MSTEKVKNMFHLFCVDSGKYVDVTIPGVDDVTRLVLVDYPAELLDVRWRMYYDSLDELQKSRWKIWKYHRANSIDVLWEDNRVEFTCPAGEALTLHFTTRMNRVVDGFMELDLERWWFERKDVPNATSAEAGQYVTRSELVTAFTDAGCEEVVNNLLCSSFTNSEIVDLRYNHYAYIRTDYDKGKLYEPLCFDMRELADGAVTHRAAYRVIAETVVGLSREQMQKYVDMYRNWAKSCPENTVKVNNEQDIPLDLVLDSFKNEGCSRVSSLFSSVDELYGADVDPATHIVAIKSNKLYIRDTYVDSELHEPLFIPYGSYPNVSISYDIKDGKVEGLDQIHLDAYIEQFMNWRKTKMTNEIAGEKHYTIIRKPIPVEFECEKCGCVFQLPLKECDENCMSQDGYNGTRFVYEATCPECKARCRTWRADHERNIKAVRKCEAGLVLENKD